MPEEDNKEKEDYLEKSDIPGMYMTEEEKDKILYENLDKLLKCLANEF